jgi:hypothetical protein
MPVRLLLNTLSFPLVDTCIGIKYFKIAGNAYIIKIDAFFVKIHSKNKTYLSCLLIMRSPLIKDFLCLQNLSLDIVIKLEIAEVFKEMKF